MSPFEKARARQNIASKNKHTDTKHEKKKKSHCCRHQYIDTGGLEDSIASVAVKCRRTSIALKTIALTWGLRVTCEND